MITSRKDSSGPAPLQSPRLSSSYANQEGNFVSVLAIVYNGVTIKNRYPIPLVQETLNRLSKARIYTKLDIIAAFYRLRMAKVDKCLAAFRTRHGLFEYLVMPFGLANAPRSFQHYANDALRPYLDDFCTAYIDDILIYSESLDKHRKHVELVLQALLAAGLQLDIDKCEFHKSEVLYLGFIIMTKGILMNPKKSRTSACS